jgi:hypothetical protein
MARCNTPPYFCAGRPAPRCIVQSVANGLRQANGGDNQFRGVINPIPGHCARIKKDKKSLLNPLNIRKKEKYVKAKRRPSQISCLPDLNALLYGPPYSLNYLLTPFWVTGLHGVVESMDATPRPRGEPKGSRGSLVSPISTEPSTLRTHQEY